MDKLEDSKVRELLARIVTRENGFASFIDFDHHKIEDYDDIQSLAYGLLHFTTNLVWNLCQSNDKTFDIDSILLGNIMLSTFNAMHEAYDKNPHTELTCSCSESENINYDYVSISFKS